MKQQSILIIEDNPMNMEMATDLLEIAKYKVLQAENAEDGIQVAREQKPDLILMDIALPGMDGLEATRLLKKNPETKNIPIVALTAHAMKDDNDEALKVGCSGYITKPINTRTFAKAIGHFFSPNTKGQGEGYFIHYL
ncbi:response regulator receiver [Candidatus Magnetomorum sp. HK-1]|nr:response regulator receiver [Candidatus Magnetomorum sp. HK-1]